GGEERAQRHMLGWFTGKIEVVHGADHAAGGIQNQVEVDDAQGNLFAHDPEENEKVGDHDGGEELEEILDPEVHHPEAPEVGGSEVGVGLGDQADGVEGGQREGGEEKQPGHV